MSRLRRGAKLLSVSERVVVPYQDADPSGVVWHGNYFRYFDAARAALLAEFEYGYREMEASGHVWPIVDTRVRYLRPVRYDDVIVVTASLDEWEYRLRIGYEIRDNDGRRTTEAYTVQVAVDIATSEMVFGASPELKRRLARRIDPDAG